ncbi:endonuclease/exonuclease/phosphatase family metal-dependent hydrolase [Dyadobacter jejuensis]|uniref:Endonuclease/exonuclease/phosphatase family metal-dependent hydrolase n=1 Tax=Dyadobacter jejuensis TaxID=1082580 RepID=A0A316AMN3_9BACT|nr:endonuclease/exonuclease/phosphatase family protein [Dyadobacter jejuensis]PWJ58050.1 endonuclease/exonuclease/phosphatase family metal-dependent hydrolase [Dyadobacter jejuensis]
MKKVIPIIFLFLFFAGNLFVLANAKPKKRIKAMAYNVHHCNPPTAGELIDVGAIARVINDHKPDFVALQEIDVNTIRSGKGRNQAQELAQLTGMFYFFSKAIDHQGGDYGVAVLSRYPIIDSMRIALPILPDQPEELRAVAAITVALSKKRNFVFASTHLGLREPNRLIQVDKIIANLTTLDTPTVIAGDFNAYPESPVIAKMDQYFTRSCTVNCQYTIPVINPKSTIDYIFYKSAKPIKVRSHQVIDEQYASDHLPVFAEFEITL